MTPFEEKNTWAFGVIDIAGYVAYLVAVMSCRSTRSSVTTL
jgi:hypothetical protein